jgi:general secretion pathway protein F
MVEVGEEAGALDKVLSDLADLLENEDEMRGEVASAIAYPCFVLGLGFLTTFVLLAFVLPRLFGMLASMVDVLPLPTRILLAVAEFFDAWWIAVVAAIVAGVLALRWSIRTPAGALRWDRFKLGLPVLGGLFRASALGRFARMLGTLERSGVPLLQGLEVVRNTVGNQVVSRIIDTVAEETRGGDSLASPLRKAGLFPPTMIQMIDVGEETGQLDTMLLRVADMQERLLRGRSRTVISLLGPVLILAVGALVGFIVIALLLPIFQMSQALN